MIPVCEPVLTGREAVYVGECLQTNWISSRGRFITEFERQFAAYCGADFGISTTSGTTALHLALAALGVGPGDEVILPAFTMAACAFAVLYTGATPVLVDADPETWNLDVDQVARRITARTKAIMPVHIYGHPVDLDPLIALADAHGIAVVEDAAEAHGAEYRGRRVGGIGRVGCFSFYGNKIITTGEGGMIVTSDPALADLASRLRDQAFDPNRRFLHTHLGYNYRMTNLQAAIGLAQLESIDAFVAARRRNAAEYNARLAGVPGLTRPVERPWAKNVYWMYSILIDPDRFGRTRDDLMADLRAAGIETRAFFYPMHRQPACLERGLFRGEAYPVADRLGDRGLYLPSGSGLTIEQIETVCQAVAAARTAG